MVGSLHAHGSCEVNDRAMKPARQDLHPVLNVAKPNANRGQSQEFADRQGSLEVRIPELVATPASASYDSATVNR